MSTRRQGGRVPRLACRAGAVLLAGAATAPAWAMGGLVLPDAPPAEGLALATGASLWALRTLPFDQPRQHTYLYPAVEVRAANGLFVSTDIGAGWLHGRPDDTQYGLRIAPWLGRNQAGVPARQLGTRLEQALFINQAVGGVAVLQASVRHGAARHRDGLLWEAGVTTALPVGGQGLIGLTLAAGWANRSYRSDRVGTAADPTRGAGWHDLQGALGYEHPVSAQWRLDTQWLAARTLGVNVGDPLHPARGRATQQSLNLSLWRDWH